MELAFLSLYKQRVLQEPLQDRLNMVDVVLLGPGENQSVIQVDEDMFVKHVAEQVVDQSLEDGGGIGEAKGHHQVLIVSRRCVERSLPLIAFPDAHQVIGIPEVQFGEDGSPLQELKGR